MTCQRTGALQQSGWVAGFAAGNLPPRSIFWLVPGPRSSGESLPGKARTGSPPDHPTPSRIGPTYALRGRPPGALK